MTEKANDAVPFRDLGRETEPLRDALDEAIRGVIDGSGFVLGPVVENFEAAVADTVGVRYAIAVASGTDALFLSLRALGIGPGDEVITTPFSFFSSATEILHAGATVVFADIDPRTFNIDPDAVRAAITPRTAAIVPVHLYGQMADMAALRSLADRYGLAVVEDAAQAFGAAQRVASHTNSGGPHELRAGAVGEVGCYSFYPTKNLGGMGDGGMVVTDDARVAARLRRLRVHGCDGGIYEAQEIGFNSRLDAIQAAVLGVKLHCVEKWNAERRAHAAAYDEALNGVETIDPPAVADGAVHTYNQYTIRCRDRAAVLERLHAAGVGCAVYYPRPLHLQEALRGLGYRAGDLPRAERAADEVVSLPIFPGLRPEERARAVAALRVPEPVAGAASS